MDSAVSVMPIQESFNVRCLREVGLSSKRRKDTKGGRRPIAVVVIYMLTISAILLCQNCCQREGGVMKHRSQVRMQAGKTQMPMQNTGLEAW